MAQFDRLAARKVTAGMSSMRRATQTGGRPHHHPLAPLRLQLLGPFALQAPTPTTDNLPKKAQGLLAYLSLTPGKPFAREELATVFWGDTRTEQARRSLRQCLMSIRTALGPFSAALVTEASKVSFQVTDHLDIDVQRFHALSQSSALSELQTATELYRGEFLAGLQIVSDPFNEWVSIERQRLSTTLSDVLYRLASACAAERKFVRAIAAANRLVELDPLEERAHRLLMQLLSSCGQRSAALKQHAYCAEILRRELGVAPERATTELAHVIRQGHAATEGDARPASQATAAGIDSDGGQQQARREASLALPDKPSLVVLPFANLSGDPDQNYFADGIVEDLTIVLGRIPWLFVIASSSALSYRGSTTDVRQVGAELSVRYVLRGSVRKSGQRLRIVAQLTDASDGRHLWADQTEGELDDVFAIQDRVTARVGATLGPELRTLEIERAQRKATENLSAYDLYLRALPRCRRSFMDNQEALRLLYQAIEVDPSYGAAYGLAARCIHMRQLFAWLPPSDPRLDEGIRLAQLAAEHGKNDSEALWMAGHAMADLAGEIDHGLALVQKSLALNPNSATACVSSCFIRGYHGEIDEALADFARAQRLNPRDSLHHVQWYAAAAANLQGGRLEAAAEALDKTLSERPTYLPAVRMKAAVWGMLGRLDEARACGRLLLAIHPNATVSEVKTLRQSVWRRRPQVLESVLAGLRLAGLPEGVTA